MNSQPLSAEQVFNAAREISSTPERAGYLKGACGNDLALRAKVDALLKAHEEAESFLQQATQGNDQNLTASKDGRAANASDPSRPAERAGQMIGRYKLLQEIGEGGFGSVWMAEQREPIKRRVALKIIKLGMDTKQVIARFEAERQALAIMDHPNIAKVLDAGATETGRPYFVMELVKGVRITEYCDTENLTTEARLGLFIKVCNAVQHAHQKGIIHRDIKPSNVMVTLHDGVPVPKVIDFGIAKAMNRDLTDKTLFTEYRQMIGTPEFMSPEQAEMSGLDIDTRSDIYSLGVLLYELLTGMTPFDPSKLRSAAINEMQRIIREDEPPRPSTRVSSLQSEPRAQVRGPNEPQAQAPGSSSLREKPIAGAQGSSAIDITRHRRTDPRSLAKLLRGDLDSIVMRAMEKDRSRRYQTANGFAMDIERHLNDEPVVATPASASYKLRKLIKRNKGTFMAAAAVFLALTLGVIGTTTGMFRAMDAETRAERELTRANEIKRLITEMFTGITPERAKGQDTTLLKRILDETAQRLANGEVEDELNSADLHYILGNVYWSLGLFTDAERHVPVALDIHTRLLGERDPKTLTSMYRQAVLLYYQKHHDKAEQLARKTLHLRLQVLGENHVDTLNSMNVLLAVLSFTSRFIEGDPTREYLLAKQREILGDGHSATLQSVVNLAIEHQTAGSYDDAEDVLRDLLRFCEREGKHMWGAEAKALLASGYLLQQRYAEAEPLLREAIKGHQKWMGVNHRQTLRFMRALAEVYIGLRWYEKAESQFNETMEKQREALGVKDRSTLKTTRMFADFYNLHLHDYGAAVKLYREILDDYAEAWGETSQETLNLINDLARVYRHQGRYAEAEPLFEKAMEGKIEALGLENRYTLASITDRGLNFKDMGQFDRALEMLEISVPIKLRVLGTEDRFTHIAVNALAAIYDELGRPEDALKLRRETLELQIALADKTDTDADTLNNAARDLLTHHIEELRDPEHALRFGERACSAEEAAGGNHLWMYLDTLALAQHRTGDTAMALETQKRAISLIPDGANQKTVEEMKSNLSQFEAALAVPGSADTEGDAP